VGNAAGGTSTSWTVLSSLSTAGALSLTGAVGATSVLKGGNELLPIGTILMWSGSIATVPAGWHICDGTNGTPNLTGRFILHADGSAFAPTQTGGAGAVSATTSTIAGHSHGGLTGAAGGATPSGVTDGQGSHTHGGATGATALTIAQMPAHTHQQSATGAFPGFGSVEGSLPNAVGPGTLTPDLNTGSTGNGAGHSHPIAVDGAHQHNLVINALPAHQHTISLDGSHSHTVTVATLPFFYALAYIMKIS
jgi:microcystin-dependent protein